MAHLRAGVVSKASTLRNAVPLASRQAQALTTLRLRAPAATRGLGATSTTRARHTMVCAASIGKAFPVEASGLLEAGHTYLDVRTEQEFQAGHVEGATNIPVLFSGPGGMSPNPDFGKAVEKAFSDKNTCFLVGCKSGKRSMMAIAQMEQMGYTDLTNLESGFDGWAGSGLPATK